MIAKDVKERKDASYDILRTSYIWARTLNPEKLDYGYNNTPPYAIPIGELMCLRHKGEVTTRFPKYIADKVDEYFRSRFEEPVVWQEPFIKISPRPIKGSTMFKGTAYVGSRSKPRVGHMIRFSTLEHRDAPEERKIKAFRYMSFKCDCKAHNFQLFKTVPFVRRTRNEGRIIDSRVATDIPAPQIEMSICSHSWASYFLLMREIGCENYGIVDEDVDDFIRFNIGNILDKKLPFYELSSHLMEKT